GKPWKVHMPSSALEAEQRQTISAAMAALANRFMEGAPGEFLVPPDAVDARIITTNAGRRMPGVASLPRFGARPRHGMMRRRETARTESSRAPPGPDHPRARLSAVARRHLSICGVHHDRAVRLRELHATLPADGESQAGSRPAGPH